MLLVAAGADALGDSPSTRRDALYLFLGTGMGASALWERSVLPQISSSSQPKADGDRSGIDEQR